MIMKDKKCNFKIFNTFHLKMIAIITMTIDHIGAVLLPQYGFLRIVGRISFPIYCFMLVNGMFYTKNVKKYLGRLLIFGIISEPLFDWTFYGKIYAKEAQNVYITLLIGLTMLISIEFIRKHQFKEMVLISYITEAILVILACGVAYFIKTDYSFYGILMIYWFYALRFNKIMMALFEAYTNMELLGGIQGFATLSLIPIFMYNGNKGYNKFKWLFYAYYPLHLFVISIISEVIQRIS